MEISYSTIVATVIGGCISLIAQIINNKYHIKIEDKRLHEEFMKLHEEEVYRQKGEKRNIILKAFELLNNLEYSVSQTQSFVDSEKKISVIEYDKLYQGIRDEINNFQSIIATYFPDLYDCSKELDSKNGAYWLLQRSLLATNYYNEKEQWKFINDRLISIVSDYNGYIGRLRSELINISREL